jgi:hypothetical protein
MASGVEHPVLLEDFLAGQVEKERAAIYDV